MSSEKPVKRPMCDEEFTHDEVLTAIEESFERLHESDLVDLFEPEPVQPVDPENSGRIQTL